MEYEISDHPAPVQAGPVTVHQEARPHPPVKERKAMAIPEEETVC